MNNALTVMSLDTLADSSVNKLQQVKVGTIDNAKLRETVLVALCRKMSEAIGDWAWMCDPRATCCLWTM